MKTFVKLVIVVAVVLASFSLPGSAKAGYIFRSKGPSADASFFTFDGCVFTDVFVFASDNTNQSPPGPAGSSSGVSMFISQYDSCTDTLLLAADGFASLAPSDFQVASKLTSASLTALVNMFDFVSGTPFDVSVDLTWTGFGSLFRQRSQSSFSSPGCSFKNRFNGTFRSADVSGTVWDGVTNFTPDPTGGTIANLKNSEMSIGCN